MNKDYTKLYDTAINIPLYAKVKGKSDKWHNARPEPYHGLFYRIRDAWNVFWLKADALYWTIDED